MAGPTREDIARAFAGRLRQLYGESREASMEKFCHANGLPYSSFSDWYYRYALPSHVALVGLAFHFDVSLDWLFGLTEDRRP